MADHIGNTRPRVLLSSLFDILYSGKMNQGIGRPMLFRSAKFEDILRPYQRIEQFLKRELAFDSRMTIRQVVQID